MVQGPGGYRFGDYLRVGLALDLVVMGTALVVVPLVWPLVPST
jgi:di/tricarboxylate transporter